ncbi:MAG: hypothetical protein GC164_07420 [Phycisphaera sp.]|nr:hypothetical protein [Phycisphaera sp.]
MQRTATNPLPQNLSPLAHLAVAVALAGTVALTAGTTTAQASPMRSTEAAALFQSRRDSLNKLVLQIEQAARSLSRHVKPVGQTPFAAILTQCNGHCPTSLTVDRQTSEATPTALQSQSHTSRFAHIDLPPPTR